MTRLSLGGRTVVRKEPLGTEAQRQLRHEVGMLGRLRGVEGVARLVDAPPYPDSIAMEDAGRTTLAVMAGWLRRLGYAPYVCGFVANVDCSDRALQRVERVDALHQRHGRRVALIGHSRGGLFARAMGARAPERVSHAISLGADLRGLIGISAPTLAAVAAVRRGLVLTRRTRAERCFTAECTCGFARDYAQSFPSDQVRLTSIYSRQDGVVRWQGAVVPEAEASR